MTGIAADASAPVPTPDMPAAGARSPMRRSRHVEARLVPTPDQRRRQARIVRLAMDELGSADAIRSFLNDRHDGLGGRPLDLAMASDAGLAAAEAAIRSGGRPD